MQRRHIDDRDDTRRQLTPIEKFHHGASIGPPRVQIADVGREKFKKAAVRPVAGGGNQA